MLHLDAETEQRSALGSSSMPASDTELRRTSVSSLAETIYLPERLPLMRICARDWQNGINESFVLGLHGALLYVVFFGLRADKTSLIMSRSAPLDSKWSTPM